MDKIHRPSVLSGTRPEITKRQHRPILPILPWRLPLPQPPQPESTRDLHSRRLGRGCRLLAGRLVRPHNRQLSLAIRNPSHQSRPVPHNPIRPPQQTHQQPEKPDGGADARRGFDSGAGLSVRAGDQGGDQGRLAEGRGGVGAEDWTAQCRGFGVGKVAVLSAEWAGGPGESLCNCGEGDGR